jgi:hypothetical protein
MMFLRRWALNRADIILGALVLSTMVLAAVVAVSSGSLRERLLGTGSDGKLIAALLAGWIAIFLAGAGGAIKVTSTRQSLTSLFRSEIKALQFGLSTMDMFEFWTKLYANPEIGCLGFADMPREEDYFKTYHSVGENIGNLHPKVVEAVVRFYMYLKMSRDAAAALKSWEKQTDSTVRKMHVVYVIRLLSISMLWGFVALSFMGFEAQVQDRDFMKKMLSSYDAVIGNGAFPELCSTHVRSREIVRFFGPGDNISSTQRFFRRTFFAPRPTG